jgi:PST family polysaccharide transporter
VLALVMFPLAVGLGAVAETLTATLLRQTWTGVAPMLTLLAVLGVTRPISGALTAYLHASNRPRDVTFVEVVGAVMILGLIATFGRSSPIATCIAVGVAFTLKMIVAMFVVRRADGTPVWRFLGQLWAPLLACVPMAAAVVGVRRGLGAVGFEAGWVMLMAEVVVGAAAFVLAAFVVAPGPANELLAIARRRRAGRA